MVDMAISLYEKIYRTLLKDIQMGQLKEGDRLPSEKELAEQFQVSRITSKKALEILAQANLIERHRGKGSYVSNNLSNLNSIDIHSSVIQEDLPLPDNWKLIGVILRDFSDCYGLKILRAIEQRCAELQVRMILKMTNDHKEEEEFAIRSLVKMGVDGLIVYPIHGKHYNGELLRLVLDGFPLVLLDRHLNGITACSVCTTNKKAAQELTDYLLDKHHQHIAFLSPPPENTSTIEERIQGYTEALLQRGIGIDQQYLITSMSSPLPYYQNESDIMKNGEILHEFIAQNPQITAFVVCEYFIAINLKQIINEMELSREIEMVCFDSVDIPFSNPLFSFVRQNEMEMGRKAMELLQKQWDGQEVPILTLVDHSLVIKS
jgi:GntR family transcriptional regulator of arabinose operon